MHCFLVTALWFLAQTPDDPPVAVGICTGDQGSTRAALNEVSVDYGISLTAGGPNCSAPPESRSLPLLFSGAREAAFFVEVRTVTDRNVSRTLPWLNSAADPLAQTIAAGRQHAFLLILRSMLHEAEIVLPELPPGLLGAEAEGEPLPPIPAPPEIAATPPASAAPQAVPEQPATSAPQARAEKPAAEEAATASRRDLSAIAERPPEIGLGFSAGAAYWPDEVLSAALDVFGGVRLDRWASFGLAFRYLTPDGSSVLDRPIRLERFRFTLGWQPLFYEGDFVRLAALLGGGAQFSLLRRTDVPGARENAFGDLLLVAKIWPEFPLRDWVALAVMPELVFIPTAREVTLPGQTKDRYSPLEISLTVGVVFYLPEDR